MMKTSSKLVKKKNNKNLEAVLQILKALDNKISQPVAQEALKDCDGDADRAIDLLRSIMITVSTYKPQTSTHFKSSP